MLAINSRRPRLASEGLRSRLTAGVRAGPVFALAQDDLRASMLRRARRSLRDRKGGVCRTSDGAIEIRPDRH